MQAAASSCTPSRRLLSLVGSRGTQPAWQAGWERHVRRRTPDPGVGHPCWLPAADQEFQADIGCSQPQGSEAASALRFGLWAAKCMLDP
jgi:hypothetical protein